MTQIIAAIPTTYNGVRFRSRLEAKWAAFFDLMGWKWEYEPIDLKGYIPDFILTRRKILVEVKPFETSEDINKSRDKIAASGWRREALLVGHNLFFDGKFGTEEIAHFMPPSWDCNRAKFIECGPCEIGLVGRGDRCRICGESATSKIDIGWIIEIEDRWKEAANTVQYKGR